jgi:hypothetical protein
VYCYWMCLYVMYIPYVRTCVWEYQNTVRTPLIRYQLNAHFVECCAHRLF